MTDANGAAAGPFRAEDAAVDAVLEALQGLRYGQLEVQLHDGRVVKIMRTEKVRCFDNGATKASDLGVRRG